MTEPNSREGRAANVVSTRSVNARGGAAGDADGGGDPNIGDATFLVKYIFQNGDAPPCDDAADADDDINIGDATYIVKFIFQDGKFPVCGTTGT